MSWDIEDLWLAKLLEKILAKHGVELAEHSFLLTDY